MDTQKYLSDYGNTLDLLKALLPHWNDPETRGQAKATDWLFALIRGRKKALAVGADDAAFKAKMERLDAELMTIERPIFDVLGIAVGVHLRGTGFLWAPGVEEAG